MTFGVTATNGDYLERMTAAVLGIYGNSKQEAMYPAYYVDAAGQKLDGGRRYTLALRARPASAGRGKAEGFQALWYRPAP